MKICFLQSKNLMKTRISPEQKKAVNCSDCNSSDRPSPERLPGTEPSLAIGIVCPFFDDLLGWPSAAVVPLLGSRPVVLGLVLIIDIDYFFLCIRRFLRLCRPGRVAGAGAMPRASKVTGAVPPVISPLSGTILALRGPGLLLGLLLGNRRRLVTGILWLLVIFRHICQSDQSGVVHKYLTPGTVLRTMRAVPAECDQGG
jgi:hypothetical protein